MALSDLVAAALALLPHDPRSPADAASPTGVIPEACAVSPTDEVPRTGAPPEAGPVPATAAASAPGPATATPPATPPVTPPAEPRVLLGIVGTPGAGKTTLAEALVAELARLRGPEWVAHVPMDGFHLADVQLDRLGLRDRKGAPETFDAAGYAALLARLRDPAEGWVYAPGFERTLEQPIAAAMVVAPSVRLVVTEGNYLLLDSGDWPRARALLHQVWYVQGDESIRMARLVGRHVEFGKSPDAARAWVAATDEPNARLIEASAPRADRFVRNDPDGWSFAS